MTVRARPDDEGIDSLSGSLISGDFLVARTYFGVGKDRIRLTGLILSSKRSEKPILLSEFAKSSGIDNDGSILYSYNAIMNTGKAMLDRHMWVYAHMMLPQGEPVLTLMGCPGGIVPVLYIEGDIQELSLE